MGKQMAVMDDERAEGLAFDAACEFFNDDQLCRRYQLTIAQLRAIREQDDFKAMVEENQRLLKDDGSEFLIKAKSYAADALDTLHALSKSAKSETVKHKAAESLLGYAKVAKGQDAAAAAGAGATLIINTNLGLNEDPKGFYQIEAVPGGASQPKPVEAERVENEDLL